MACSMEQNPPKYERNVSNWLKLCLKSCDSDSGFLFHDRQEVKALLSDGVDVYLMKSSWPHKSDTHLVNCKFVSGLFVS